MDPDPDPSVFVIDLQDASKKLDLRKNGILETKKQFRLVRCGSFPNIRSYVDG